MIVELSEIDEVIKQRYQEIDETIFIGNDESEEIIVKMTGSFELENIEILNKEDIDYQKLIKVINNVINKIKSSRNNVIKEIILEKTREN